ncbi:LamG-like jellyroll fold domain-containing protein, partial [Bacteroidota bacterium]
TIAQVPTNGLVAYYPLKGIDNTIESSEVYSLINLSNCSIANIDQNDTSICYGDSLTLNLVGPGLFTNNLVAWYPFNGNANDESGNGHHGTVVSATLTADRFGIPNSAYFFNNTQIKVDSFNNFYNQSITVSLWFKFDSIPCYNRMLQIDDHNLNRYGSAIIGTCHTPADQNKAALWVNQVGPISNNLLNDNNWHHFVGIYRYTDDSLFLYIDDTLQGENISSTTQFHNVITSLYIGKTSAEHHIGYLDDILIYNRELIPTEISYLYNSINPINSYIWSTSDTTSSINVSPTVTTTYYVTVSNGITNCIDSVTITVNPLPNVTFGNLQDLCINDSAFSLSQGSPNGGIYSGQGVSNGIFDPSISGAGNHILTYSYSDTNGCINSATQIITVHPMPSLSFNPLTSVCVNTSPFLLTAGSPVGGFYSGPGITSGIFNPLLAGTGTHILTYNYTDSNSCYNYATQNITVYPLPAVSLNPFTSLCIDAPPFTLSGGSPSGGSYTGPGISSGVFNPILAGTGTHIITYYYTDTNGCSNAANQSITVFPLPTINFSPISPMCIDDIPLTLTTATPAGGIYSGSGVSNGIFDPQISGTGTHVITYNYIDGNGCANSALQVIIVNPLPMVNFINPGDVCLNETPFTLTGGTPAGGIYLGNGIHNGIFYPDSAGLGIQSIIYYYLDANGCANTDTQSINVNQIPAQAIIIGPINVLQFDSALYSINQSPGYNYKWLIENGSILNGQQTNAVSIYWGAYGSGKIAVIETNLFGCPGDTNQLNVNIGNISIQENSNKSNIEIYPNPNTGEFIITFSHIKGKSLIIQLFDQMGKIVYQE